ncbi:MAG: response regulator [bacterium]|nr:response regulator [bacterium]
MHILIVDDEPELCEKLCEELRRLLGADVSIVFADCERTMRQRMGEQKADLILMDGSLNENDFGPTIVRHIRHEECRIPIIMCSSSEDANDIGVVNGANAICSKLHSKSARAVLTQLGFL